MRCCPRLRGAGRFSLSKNPKGFFDKGMRCALRLSSPKNLMTPFPASGKLRQRISVSSPHKFCDLAGTPIAEGGQFDARYARSVFMRRTRRRKKRFELYSRLRARILRSFFDKLKRRRPACGAFFRGPGEQSPKRSALPRRNDLSEDRPFLWRRRRDLICREP